MTFQIIIDIRAKNKKPKLSDLLKVVGDKDREYIIKTVEQLYSKGEVHAHEFHHPRNNHIHEDYKFERLSKLFYRLQ